MAGTSFKQRRGTAQLWQTTNVILLEGELGYETDTGRIKFGDGVTRWNALPVAMRSDYLPILGKAADSDKLDGFDSTVFTKVADAELAYLKKTDAATTYLRSDAPTSAATVNAVAKRDAQGKVAFSEVTLNTQTASSSAARKDYVDNTVNLSATAERDYVNGLILPAGASRTLLNYFSSRTSYPTGSQVRLGDRVWRSDLFCEMYFNGGVWRQVSDARGTAAQRTGMSTATKADLHDGFRFYETDTKVTSIWNGTLWVAYDSEWQSYIPSMGVGSSTASLGNATVNFRYLREGRKITIIAALVLGSTTSFNGGSGLITLDYPAGLRPYFAPAGGTTHSIGGPARQVGSATTLGSVVNQYNATPSLRRMWLVNQTEMVTGGGTGGGINLTTAGHAAYFKNTYETAFEA